MAFVVISHMNQCWWFLIVLWGKKKLKKVTQEVASPSMLSCVSFFNIFLLDRFMFELEAPKKIFHSSRFFGTLLKDQLSCVADASLLHDVSKLHFSLYHQ